MFIDNMLELRNGLCSPLPRFGTGELTSTSTLSLSFEGFEFACYNITNYNEFNASVSPYFLAQSRTKLRCYNFKNYSFNYYYTNHAK